MAISVTLLLIGCPERCKTLQSTLLRSTLNWCKSMVRQFIYIFLILMLCSCSKVYYNTLEQFGVEKRDILVDRVEEARSSQKDVQEDFQSALDQFRTVVEVDGGDLEKQYDKLDSRYRRAQNRAEEVSERIDAVENVGKDLFREWKKELTEYQDEGLRRRSREQLDGTQDRFDDLLAAMRRAESRMEPVLKLFNDQVLFLKHNLNARAIGSLEVERVRIEERVAHLIEEMQASIAEADAFIAELR